jgi:hypothetical protein
MDATDRVQVEKAHEGCQDFNLTQLRDLRNKIHEQINTHCALLELPVELRDRIYRYSLLKKEKIDITTQFEQPALLQSCRQIRSETIEMWYKKNDFFMTITDCDASRLVASSRHCVRVIGAVNIKERLHGKTNWCNLMDWCHDVHTDAGDRYFLGPEISDEHKPTDFSSWVVVTSALRITRRNYSVSWNQCEETLRVLRRMAGLLVGDSQRGG